MPTYFGLWKINYATPLSPDPAMAIPMFERFLAQMKGQIASGLLKEIHEFLGGGAGYLITGDHPKEKVAATLAAWAPFVLFELHETIPVTKSLELALAEAKQRAAAMKT